MPSANVEPHFDRRPVQIVAATVASLALIWLALSGWQRMLSTQHTDSTAAGEVARRGAGALIEVDINRAEARELALLPGIGPVLARRIVENRDRLGPFESVSDLTRVHGIGEKTVQQIEPICFVESQALVSRSRGE